MYVCNIAWDIDGQEANNNLLVGNLVGPHVRRQQPGCWIGFARVGRNTQLGNNAIGLLVACPSDICQAFNQNVSGCIMPTNIITHVLEEFLLKSFLSDQIEACIKVITSSK